MTAIKGVRVSELAKELEMTNAELVLALKDLGVEAEGPAALIDLDTVGSVRGLLGKTVAGKTAAVHPDATVREVAEAIGVPPNAAVKELMKMGQLIAANQKLARPMAEQLAAAFGYTLTLPKAEATTTAPEQVKPLAPKHKPPGGAGQPRPPVVTIMGHVDHGKTTLLDAIRKTNVVEGEFGGITQHIGAYQVEVDHDGNKRKITFLDTPGHAAFTAMRARGASVTDIVVLVVAADDGIMPQTVEAINHAQAANVPMIVAINKVDKPDSKPDRVKQQLTEHNLVVEEYGGEVIAVPVSAKTGQGLPDLLDYILLVADVAELKADPTGKATGAIIEARVDPGRGPVATVLVQSGTLRVGDSMVAGVTYGKVRAMTNERGERLDKAVPATPVEVVGLNGAPSAGDQVEVVKDDREARRTAERRQQSARAARFTTTMRMTLADLSKQVAEGMIKDLNLVVKGDVQGSVEAVVSQLNAIGERQTDDEVRISVKMSGVGPITETDIDFASSTNSIVIGFNVRPDPAAQRAAERDGVDVRLYNIIYDLVEDIERARRGMLAPIYEEVELGKAEVRQVFKTPKGIFIAGSYVTDGKIVRGAEMRVRRGKDILFTGKIDTLRHIKDDVREMAQGYECGITVHDWVDYKVEDVLECYEMREVPRT